MVCNKEQRNSMSIKIKYILLIISALPLFAITAAFNQKGTATYYATKLVGRKTTSGEKYDPFKMTAAHATLPLQSYVTVKNLKNNKAVVVRINDRMSRKSRFVIDLSKVAAQKLGIKPGVGMAPVLITKANQLIETAEEATPIDTTQWAEWK